MSLSKLMKWITGGGEALLGFPILGASIVMGNFYVPLFIMLILHIITLVITKNERGSTTGSVLGIITSCIAWIPLVGITMHILTAIVLITDAARPTQVNQQKIL